jgi:hypothetical protein
MREAAEALETEATEARETETEALDLEAATDLTEATEA